LQAPNSRICPLEPVSILIREVIREVIREQFANSSRTIR
jgi:hypothetical protein